ncbi:hypothetical protein F2P45_32580 [Massilia sp. CCM 8733]|uniref:Uncharacterized protein n=1 Tax=Massilia mucilaginosa TaxID=2609282 RepID=A0ABX0P344_9BURK|nr:hypothetical protein [Massilia mucilaginosa]NHZ93700.1 hypothetical protein [Massilia mucilaginosa]
MTDEDPSPPARRQVPIKLLLAGVYLLPALIALFGLAFSIGGGYLCGLLIAAAARNHGLLADPDRVPAIGAVAGVVFFLFALAYQFLTRNK